MPPGGLLHAIRRFWLVTIIGLLATLGTVTLVAQSRGVYWAQVDVLFAAPQPPDGANTLMATHETIIATAGLIQRDVTGARETSRVVSDSVTLFGQGVRKGESVRMPNAGGQWANNFEKPVLDVQVVDETKQGAEVRLERVLKDISTKLNDRQREAGVNGANLITIRLLPTKPEIRYIAGYPLRAAAITGVLGLGFTLSLVGVLQGATTRRAGAREERNNHSLVGPLEHSGRS